MSDHLDHKTPRAFPNTGNCPHCGQPHGGHSTCPHCGENVIDTPAQQTEQPEAKEYPPPYEHGFCPFTSCYITGPPGAAVKKLMPCDPDACQLGLHDPGCCALINIAATIDADCAADHDRLTEQRLTRELLQHLSDRLAANLQSIHHNNSRLIDLAKAFDESSFLQILAGIQLMLTQIHLNLERAYPPPESAQPT